MSEFLSERARAERARLIANLRKVHPMEHEQVDWPFLIGAEKPRRKRDGARVAFVGSDYGGGGRLRSFWPAIAMSAAGVNVVHCGTRMPAIGSFDVLWVHRLLHDEHLRALERVLTPGVVLIHDEDDAIDALPPGFHFGRYERERDLYERLLANHRTVLELCDVLTVSTPFLAEHWAGRARRIRVCPNYLPAWVQSCAPAVRPPGEMVRVGWAGLVDVHDLDLGWIGNLARLMLAGAEFTTVGSAEATVRLLRLPRRAPRETFPFEYAARPFYGLMARADVGIVPLQPGLVLNLGKSWLKALEYHALGVPVVAARLPEQAALIVEGETGFLADDPGEFVAQVQRLVWDPRLRAEMGHAALERAREFELERNIAVWLAVLAEIGAADMLAATTTGPGLAGREEAHR